MAITLSVTSDLTSAAIGEEIPVVLTITNTGDTPVENPSLGSWGVNGQLSVVEGSLTINGVPYAGSLGIINPQQTVVVNGRHIITELPTTEGNVANYMWGVTLGDILAQFLFSIPIRCANLTAGLAFTEQPEEWGQPIIADLGETLTIDGNIGNNGNVSATDVMFTPAIPSEFEVVPGSWVISVPFTAQSPGILLTDPVTPEANIAIQFRVRPIRYWAGIKAISGTLAWNYVANTEIAKTADIPGTNPGVSVNPPPVAFSLTDHGNIDEQGYSMSKAGQVSGSAVITVGSTPVALQLVNKTPATVVLGNTPKQAGITVTRLK
jgi:uncharacterized repeat protein (TIGR01451 family)